nr:p53-induced death domain-containing protein 1 isoform X3 [Loxodonta africana]
MAAAVEGLEPEAAAEDATRGAAEEAVDAGLRVPPLLAGNRLNLDLYPGGCHQLLHLCAQRSPQLLQVEFLRLSTHEDPGLLGATLAQVPGRLPCLRSLVLKGGQHRDALGACLRGCLTSLPDGLSNLARLAHLDLSFNSLEALPACVPQLRGLDALLLSHNCLLELPEALGALPSLTFLAVTHNCLQTLPTALGALSTLRRLDLSENLLDTLPPEIGGLSSLAELNLASNRLQSLPASLGTPVVPEMPRLFLTTDLDSFPVTPQGCSVTLACGIRLHFPAGATATPITIHYRLWLPEPRLVPLGPHDTLLSHVLELQPHGVVFQQDVGLWLLFVPPRVRRYREVVVRTLSEDSWTDLETHLEEEAPKRERCSAPQDIPGSRSRSPRGPPRSLARSECRWYTWASRELRALLGEPEAAVSPLLCLWQSGPPSFLRPVTVQLPLPPGITGLTLDRSRLHLLYQAPPVATWDDITAQVALELTHLYARFQVTHFSWYWLWYTTKSCVGGLARKAWARLRLHRVNLIALQRRRDPEQVLLQCLPRNKVEATLKRLLERYHGPEPSDTVELFEGEKFFAAFERGIDVDADRPDCVEGRICFVFYSHLKNVKEVYVTTALDREAQAVRGQVSFYRGTVPTEVPKEAEAARQKKGLDALWMATLPIKLPRLRGSEGTGQGLGAGLSLAPLNLGDAESGFLTQSNLLSVARRLGLDWPAVALHLGLPYRELQRIRLEFRDDLDGQIRHMLFSWAERQAGRPGAVGLLVQALEQSDRRDLAEEVRAVLELGRQKYQAGILRTGLAPGDPAPPSPSASESRESTEA